MQRIYLIEVEMAYVSLGGSKYEVYRRKAATARDAVRSLPHSHNEDVVKVTVESTGEVVPKKLWNPE